MLESFFFNDTATTEIYTLSLHDALPIFALVAHLLSFDDGIGDTRGEEADGAQGVVVSGDDVVDAFGRAVGVDDGDEDRKSTRLNSSHANISYAVFCLKKKKTHQPDRCTT